MSVQCTGLSTFLGCGYPLFLAPFGEIVILSHCIAKHFCQKQVVLQVWVFFSFHSIDIFVYLYANSMLFWLLLLYNNSWNQRLFALQHGFLIPQLFWLVYVLWIFIWLRIHFHEKACWDFDWDYFESIDKLGESWYLNNIKSSDPWMRYIPPLI